MFFQDDEDIGGEDAEAKAMEASANIYLYAGELAKKHAESPLNNIVGALLDGKVNDEYLTEDEFQAFFLMLIAAGNESTRSVTAHGMRLLIENPDQLQKLIDDPECIGNMVSIGEPVPEKRSMIFRYQYEDQDFKSLGKTPGKDKKQGKSTLSTLKNREKIKIFCMNEIKKFENKNKKYLTKNLLLKNLIYYSLERFN